MNTDLRKKAKKDFGKDIFKLMNNAVFGKTMKNLRKHGDVKIFQWKEEGIIQYHNQIIILQILSQNTHQQQKHAYEYA